LFRRPAPVSAADPEVAQARDRGAEEELERDRGPAEGKRQDLVNSFRLEVLKRTLGRLSGGFGGNEMESAPQGLKPSSAQPFRAAAFFLNEELCRVEAALPGRPFRFRQR
jgi:hypothetical protein